MKTSFPASYITRLGSRSLSATRMSSCGKIHCLAKALMKAEPFFVHPQACSFANTRSSSRRPSYVQFELTCPIRKGYKSI